MITEILKSLLPSLLGKTPSPPFQVSIELTSFASGTVVLSQPHSETRLSNQIIMVTVLFMMSFVLSTASVLIKPVRQNGSKNTWLPLAGIIIAFLLIIAGVVILISMASKMAAIVLSIAVVLVVAVCLILAVVFSNGRSSTKRTSLSPV